MMIIVGLGNPGTKYEGNRHNIGFMAVDAIHRRHPFGPWSKKFKSEISEGELDGVKVLLMKPQTFMNLSGEAVGEAMRFYKLAPADIVIIHDELDLPAAKARMKVGGGHGGHNGLKSIDAHCGKDYRRLRLGIGHPGDKDRVHAHVLGDFAKVDRDWLDLLLDSIADNAVMLAKGADSQLMNKVALALGGKAEDEPAKAPKPAKTGPTSAAPAKSGPGQSHIRAARNFNQPKALPSSGPMADMLKKLFGKKDD